MVANGWGKHCCPCTYGNNTANVSLCCVVHGPADLDAALAKDGLQSHVPKTEPEVSTIQDLPRTPHARLNEPFITH